MSELEKVKKELESAWNDHQAVMDLVAAGLASDKELKKAAQKIKVIAAKALKLSRSV